MKILVQKNRLVRKMLVTARGQVKTDQVKLPANSLRVTGIHVTAVSLQLAPDGAVARYYFGVSNLTAPTPAMIGSLPTGILVANHVNVTGDAGAGQYFYYAHPIYLMDPMFRYNGFEGGFLNLGTLTVATPEGQFPYRVWRSLNANLGNTTLDILH